MNKRGLRVVQIVCLAVAFASFMMVSRLSKPENNGTIRPIHWVIVLAAIYCAFSAFTLQRTITKGPKRQPTKIASTPLSRWRAGHLVRLFFPLSVALWGDVLVISGGPSWLAYSLCGLGILLLLVWRHENVPVQPEPSRNG